MAPLKDVYGLRPEDHNKKSLQIIGDPTSLKPEGVDTLQPTDEDMPNESDKAPSNPETKNPDKEKVRQLGDHASLKAEKSGTEPTKDDRGVRGTGRGREGDGKSKL